MTETDGTACARLPVFPSGFPPSDPSSCPRPPLVVWCTYSERSTCAAVHAAQVCLRVSVSRVQFVKWNLNDTRNTRARRIPEAGSAGAAYDKALKIHSINRRWTRSRRGRLIFLRESLRLPTCACAIRYSRYFTRARTSREIKIFREHLALAIIIMSAATN